VENDWIESNLEAFSSLTEVLLALRERLRGDLTTAHGEEWFTRGVPNGVRERLEGKKDREDTVAWYSSGERELFEYVDFFDMVEILEGQQPGIELLAGVFPQSQILRARLMELQIVAQRLGHAHPVADEELSLLATLRSRLNLAPQTTQHLRAGADPHEVPAPTPSPLETTPPAPPEARQPTPPTPGPAPEPDTPEPEAPTASAPVNQPIPVTLPFSPAATPRTIPRPEGPRTAPPTPSFDEVLQALDRRQNPIVLRALYAEIMAVAEAVWARGTASSLKVWYIVRESPWYQEHFVPLGLKPVSDFYSIVEDLQSTLGSSAPKEKVHEFLNSRAFAQVLLSLRELFQRALKT